MSNYLQDIWQLQEKDPKQNFRSHVSTNFLQLPALMPYFHVKNRILLKNVILKISIYSYSVGTEESLITLMYPQK